jgi:hypothetical protein
VKAHGFEKILYIEYFQVVVEIGPASKSFAGLATLTVDMTQKSKNKIKKQKSKI